VPLSGSMSESYALMLPGCLSLSRGGQLAAVAVFTTFASSGLLALRSVGA